MIFFNKRITETLIRLRACSSWSVSLLFDRGSHIIVFTYFCLLRLSYIVDFVGMYGGTINECLPVNCAHTDTRKPYDNKDSVLQMRLTTYFHVCQLSPKKLHKNVVCGCAIRSATVFVHFLNNLVTILATSPPSLCSKLTSRQTV